MLRRYPFSSLLVLLLVSCALCSATSADQGVQLFKEGPVKALKANGTGHEEFLVDRFGNPSLVLANGVMVGQVRLGKEYKTAKVLTKYIGTGRDGWAERAIKDVDENWEAQWALESEISRRSLFASVAKKDIIYALHVTDVNMGIPTSHWKFVLLIGKVTHADDGAISIAWKNKTVEERFTKDIQKRLDNVDLSHRSGFLMDDGTFVFFFAGTRADSSTTAFIIAHSKDPKTYLTFHLDDKPTENCISNCFTWKKKLFLLPLVCFDDSFYDLYESDDMGRTWKESSGKLAEKLHGRSRAYTYTPITIGERRALLFTQARLKKDIYDVNLFMVYNDNIHPLGKIFNVSWGLAAGSLLYTKDELFYLGAPKTYYITVTLLRLKEQLEKIKKLLDATPPDSAFYTADEVDTSSDSASDPVDESGTHSDSASDPINEAGKPPSIASDSKNKTGIPSDSVSVHARRIINGNLVHLHINVALVLLCFLFGMWVPIAL